MDFFAIPITKKTISKCIEEILPYEHSCVNLAECLKKQKRIFDLDSTYYTFIKAEAFFLKSKEKNKFIGIVVLAAHSVLFHCFCTEIPNAVSKYIANNFLKKTQPLSVMGEMNTTIYLEQLISKSLALNPIRFENYKLLVLKNKSLEPQNFCARACSNLNSNLKFLKPSIEEAELLCPMEIEYNETEVLAPGVKASPEMCLKLLKKRINANALYAVKKDEEYIAKAGINASGFRWNQIGGVFTSPEYRNKGVGAANMLMLIKDCEQYKKKCVLFVKLKNFSARSMYKKIGFIEFCDFRISYF